MMTRQNTPLALSGFSMQELLLLIEESIEESKSLFIRLHAVSDYFDARKKETARLEVHNLIEVLVYQSDDVFRRLKIKRGSNEGGALINPAKFLLNVLRLSGDCQTTIMGMTKKDSDSLRFMVFAHVPGHGRILFADSTNTKVGDYVEEMESEQPELVISDLEIDVAAQIYNQYTGVPRRNTVWIQIPQFKLYDIYESALLKRDNSLGLKLPVAYTRQALNESMVLRKQKTSRKKN